MVDDVINDHADATRVRLREQLIKISQRAVGRLNRAKVGGGVAMVVVSAGGHGHQPDALDAEVLQVVQSLREAAQIANTVCVAVFVGAHKDLHECAMLPTCGQRAGGRQFGHMRQVNRCGGGGLGPDADGQGQ